MNAVEKRQAPSASGSAASDECEKREVPAAQAATAAAKKTWPCVGDCGTGMPAPGARCLTCIQAKRGRAVTSVAPAAESVVTARDAAILGALKFRPWTRDGLLTVLPAEPGQTPEQRATALNSALIRLTVKKLVKEFDGRYVAA